MASLIRQGGRKDLTAAQFERERVLWHIQFFDKSGERKTIRLGRLNGKQATSIHTRIEKIIGNMFTGELDEDTARWVARLDDKMHERLADVGLVRSREETAARLGPFLEKFLESVKLKPSTMTTYLQTKRALVDHFGADKPIRDIEPTDAEAWRTWLQVHEKLAQATVSKRVKTARQAFRKACKWRMITENPFADVLAGTQANKARQFFVTPEMARAVLDACPDAEWRLLFALSRFGGLRCPSEHLALKWTDVLWDRGRIRVSSCKTEHLDGGDQRYVPIFDELYQPLLDAFDAAPDGAEYVISRYRDTTVNLRTQLTRIVKRAGLIPWPKLWHNLRSSRQTELAMAHPIHLVCEWLGNSVAVAQAHYLQIRDEDYMRVAEKALQKAQQQDAETHRGASQTENPANSEGNMLQGFANPCDDLRNLPMTPTGSEQPSENKEDSTDPT